PDGRRIVAIVTSEGKTMLWLRPLNALASQPLLGTDGATFPFWSPDSRFVGFFAGGKLKKIDISGGAPPVICRVRTQPRGGSWGREGTIVFAAGSRDPISKVAAAGGTSTPVTHLAKSEFSHRFPSFLPDGHHFLYVGLQSFGNAANRNMVFVGSIDG